MKTKFPLIKVVSEQTLEIVFRCCTVSEAEAFIAGIALYEKDIVESGAFGIDGPENIVNKNYRS